MRNLLKAVRYRLFCHDELDAEWIHNVDAVTICCRVWEMGNVTGLAP